MLRLPARFAAVILRFAPLFFQRTWRQAEVLLLGAILAPGGRTVTGILADVISATGWAPHTVCSFLTGLKKKGYSVTVLDRIRQVGPGKEGAKGSYSIYRIADADAARAEVG